jgi:hypothetical protein
MSNKLIDPSQSISLLKEFHSYWKFYAIKYKSDEKRLEFMCIQFNNTQWSSSLECKIQKKRINRLVSLYQEYQDLTYDYAAKYNDTFDSLNYIYFHNSSIVLNNIQCYLPQEIVNHIYSFIC